MKIRSTNLTHIVVSFQVRQKLYYFFKCQNFRKLRLGFPLAEFFKKLLFIDAQNFIGFKKLLQGNFRVLVCIYFMYFKQLSIIFNLNKFLPKIQNNIFLH